MVEGEYLEIFEDLQQQLRRIRPQSLDGDVWRLPGARAVLPASLRAMMGELPAADLARLTRTLQWRSALLAEGKTHTEVDDIVRQDYNNFTEGHSEHTLKHLAYIWSVLLKKEPSECYI